jgi:Ca-activated chloride channel homolog
MFARLLPSSPFHAYLEQGFLLTTLLRRLLLALAFAVFGIPFAVAAPQAPDQTLQQSQAIRVSVERVDVGVIVTNVRGQFVEDLHRDDFHVLDNGIEQPITDFATVEQPAQVLILVEAGPAVYFLEAGHRNAVYALLNGLSVDDRVAIAHYAEAAQLLCDLTADKRAAASVLGDLRFNLGFGQLNLSSSLNATLDWLAQIPGKKSLVLLSTGVDTSPNGASQALLSRLKTSDVRLFAVSLSGELLNPKIPGKKSSGKTKASPDVGAAMAEELAQAAELLKVFAAATGGRAYFPVSTKDFDAVYADIAQLVRHEYSIAFVPPFRDGKLHLLQVRVEVPSTIAQGSPSPSFHLDHRQAYLATPLQ